MGGMVKVNIADLKKLQANMNKLQSHQVDQFIETVAKELAARLLAKVIKRTPVGKNAMEDVLDDQGNAVVYKKGAKKGQAKQTVVRNGGTLRRGWTAKTEAEAMAGSGVGNAAAYANSLVINKAGGVYQIEIVNPVHYASYVEYGHRQTPGRYVPAIGKRLKQSWVEGKFMLTISEQELQADAPRIIEHKLKLFLGGAFTC